MMFTQDLILVEHHVHEVMFVETLTTLELKDLANSGDVALIQPAMRVMHKAEVIEIHPHEATKGELPRTGYVVDGHHCIAQDFVGATVVTHIE